MKSEVRVAVIGGGVVGCSVLYHLTKGGWNDVVLLEREELTAGSTWHAAGGFHTLNGDPNVAKLQEYTIELYKEIEEISEQACGLHITGGIMLVSSEERLDWLKAAHAKNRYLGVQTELISLDEAYEHFPLMDKDKFTGAMWHPLEGHLDPSGTTHAYAKAARANGAEVYRHTCVTDLQQRVDGTWDIVTNKGNIHAEHVVNAGGLWAREVGRMVGQELPVLAMAHQYILTEEMEEVVAYNKRNEGKEVVHCIDFDGEIYMRQERTGMLMGTYEKNGEPWSEHDTPWDFGAELLPPDLDKIADNLTRGFERFPAFNNAGIKNIIHGPFTFAPDGNPVIGPVRNLDNYWLAVGVMAGFSQGGGVGLALANWIIDGDPGFDVWAMDAARYGDWATKAYTNAKVRENYGRRFSIAFPNEELPAGRPLRMTPIHDRLAAKNAVFGAAAGLEHALWFAPEGKEAVEEVTFKRSNAHEAVAEECAAVRNGVGLLETSSFAKYEITGPDAEAWLSRLLANKMPRNGRITLTPMLNPAGKLIGDFTVARIGDERFYIFGSGVAEDYHMRWFESHLPESGVRIQALGLNMTGLSIAGPKSRELLQKLTYHDVSGDAFRFMAIRELDLGMIPALVGRISFTGDLGYEIWVKPEFQQALFDLLMAEGEEFGIKLFGGRALNALRLEKGFGTWAREYRPIYSPFEAGLDRFVDLTKNDFIGREAAARDKQEGCDLKLLTFTVEAEDADVIGDEPIWHEDKVVGWITSGGYAHDAAKSVALGYVPTELANGGTSDSFEIEILGNRRPAKVQTAALFDPDAARMRG
ncbi:FAD-dependent oxidoreductase [Pelagibius sp. Alg239-R121]|uniref:GcvT family protein n=1 Tax=Pelagibius sp. Alg239-R121 TaxID=2993448 RepID=UPI0024A6A3C5|nr:FAD-dependent oxidoreductase [Pelagibius sp. Alg239-R121]